LDTQALKATFYTAFDTYKNASGIQDNNQKYNQANNNKLDNDKEALYVTYALCLDHNQPSPIKTALIHCDSTASTQHSINTQPHMAIHPNAFIHANIGSEFLHATLNRFPDCILTAQLLADKKSITALLAPLFDALCSYNGSDETKTHTPDEKRFHQALRQLRKIIMASIIYCDLNRQITLFDTTQALSDLADFCVQRAADYHMQQLRKQYGLPKNADNIEQPLMVIGMGKLGAFELNLSSDIDLIFAYPEKGYTDHPTHSIENAVFFNKLGQKVIYALDANTVDGFVFRVDMRLRPFGQSGALTYSLAALEDYYQTQGREWERFAMVKARIIACTQPSYNIESHKIHHVSNCPSICEQNTAYQKELSTLLTLFTYRKFIDYSVIDALRSLKKMITQDIARRNLGDNIKLGTGGIREIEFIAQAFQLIRGGRDVSLQDNRIRIILPLLAQHGFIDQTQAEHLIAAYTFLRNTEHAIQAYRDEQTQTLPEQPEQQARLAMAMGFTTWEAFFIALNTHRTRVSAIFKEVIAPPEIEQDTCKLDDIWQYIWAGTLPDEHVTDALQKRGFDDPKNSLALLNTLHDSHTVQSLQSQGRDRLDTFMPLLLAHIATTSQPSRALTRILVLVESVIRRSAYLLLLIENPSALAQLIKLSDASPHISHTLAKHPALLDELLDSRTLYLVPTKDTLASELHVTMLRIDPNDLEQQMETLRYFKAAHSLRIAACEISGSIPLMKVSDYLSMLAEVITDYVTQHCWQDMTQKHGYPDGDTRETPNFIVVGYGKFGGLEMSHGSDLDLVFIHNASTHGESNGKKSIENTRFYTRLGQKIIHMMNTRTASGQLYEIDMRLRPSGNSGMLVSTLAAFEKYQRESAWTWEHQALVRARAISGDKALKQAFGSIRNAILTIKRDNQTLKDDIIAMRKKMRDHLGTQAKPNNEEKFHIKHDAGGIVDIEFMVQYAVLAWSNAEPALITYTDNIRIIECLQDAKLFSAQQAHELITAYKALRAMGHRLALQDNATVISDDSLKSEQANVKKHWHTLLH